MAYKVFIDSASLLNIWPRESSVIFMRIRIDGGISDSGK